MHLDELEEAVGTWLEAAFYKSATPDRKRALNRAGLMPALKAEMPPVYRLWRLCQDNNTLWWSGGMAAQPHILMMEFEVCKQAHANFLEYAADVQRIVSETESTMAKAARSGSIH